MLETEQNWERDLAKDFILNTNRNIFLTGKAGTGKTTLLKEILGETDKNYMVAAPTGVAAINAGGITLHSLFLLPLKTFIPIRDAGHSMDLFCDPRQLTKHQKFNRAKLDLLLELELLVIDEISMVRADVFDAIDTTLRRVRRNQAPFGGVQLLVIGDLFQLAPVVRRDIEQVLGMYYKSPYFFDSRAWQSANAVMVELQIVYRQEEQKFVDLLNSIRKGERDQSVLDEINKQFDENPAYSNTITLTTHNNKANTINADELAKLDAEEISLTAKVTGKFPESAFPTPEQMVLKKGAQVMFIRNHSEDLYFNGKIGQITEIGKTMMKVKGDDGITVLVEPVDWKNNKYILDEESGKIVQEEVGSFHQYPLRLAWAVTVHKSQGLTFDRVILDLEGSFASGQLYVALSRCRSLDGLTLSSKINLQNIIVDRRITDFSKANHLAENINEILEQEKNSYGDLRLANDFRVDKIGANLDLWNDSILNKDISGKADCLILVKDLQQTFDKILGVSNNFLIKLDGHLKNKSLAEGFVEERCSKAIGYFTNEIYQHILSPIIKHGGEYTVKAKSKTYLRELEEVEDSIWKIIEKLYQLTFREKTLWTEPIEYKRGKRVKIAKKKKVVGETYNITLEMLESGKSIALIAKERGLAQSTIEAHVTRLIREERISILRVMKEQKIKKAMKAIESYPDLELSELILRMPFKMSFGELRWVLSHKELESSAEYK